MGKAPRDLITAHHAAQIGIHHPPFARFLCACASRCWRYGEQVGLLRPQASPVIHRISSSGNPFPQGSSLRVGCVRKMYSTRALHLLAAELPTPPAKATALISSSSIFQSRSSSQDSMLTICPSFGFSFEVVLSHG